MAEISEAGLFIIQVELKQHKKVCTDIAINVGNLKGGAKFELLFNKSASERGGDKSERVQINP